MASVTIPVEGMSCGGCVSSVQKALLRLDGVAAASASLSPGQVEVQYDAGRIAVPALVQSIEDAGYGVPAGWQASS